MPIVLKCDGGKKGKEVISSAAIFRAKLVDLHREDSCIAVASIKFSGTTNEAEIRAVWLGIKLLRQFPEIVTLTPDIYIFSDSELTINLLKRIYQCHNETLKKWRDWIIEEIVTLENQGLSITTQWINRDLNYYTDKLCKLL